MISNGHQGILEIRIFVAKHNDPHRGSARMLAAIPCNYGDAGNVFEQWREANGDWARSGHNNSIEARFNMGYAIVN